MNNLTVKKESILFDFLLNYYNKKKVKTLLKYKQVQVNKQIITQFDYLLKPGDVVTVTKNNQDLKFEIIYEDNQLIVINKPAGLLWGFDVC